MPKPPAEAKPAAKPAPPPAAANPFEGVDIKDPVVISAATRIQASFRMHKNRMALKEKSIPKFSQVLKDMFVMEGSAVTFFARVWGIPDPVIKWFKDGQEVKEGPKHEIKFDDKDGTFLVIRNADGDDVGTYTCQATNSFGEAFDSARLALEVPAKCTKQPENITVKAGDSFEIKVEIAGEPEPDVIWTKGKKEIDEGGRFSYEDSPDYSILRVEKAQAGDAGKYEIEIVNDLGKARAYCTVKVA